MIKFPYSVLNILEILFPSTVTEWNNLDLTILFLLLRKIFLNLDDHPQIPFSIVTILTESN